VWTDLMISSLVPYRGGWVVGGWSQKGPPYGFTGALAFLGAEPPIVIAQRPGIARPTIKKRTVTVEAEPLGIADYRVIDATEADRRFGLSERLNMPYDVITRCKEIRLYEGDVVVDRFDNPSIGDGSHHVIVDGNLIVTGGLRWRDYGAGSFLLVTGAISTGSTHVHGCPTIITPLLEAEHVVACDHGDDGGYLEVGTLRAALVCQSTYFNVHAGTIDAFVLGDHDYVDPRVDRRPDEAAQILRVELINEDGEAIVRALIAAMAAGTEVFRDDLDA
jgi:hypothetical protein